jgi:SAM-dependent methyltransferase
MTFVINSRVVKRLRRKWINQQDTQPLPPVNDRQSFVELIPPRARVLEIGPFAAPMLHGPNVSYVDVMSTHDLRARAIQLGLDPEKVPEINWVSTGSDLSVVPDQFNVVVSSHAIEHQPDIIGHLQDVADLLLPGGRYFLLIPDHRYCFDHFFAPSTAQQMIDAHLEKRTVQPDSVVIAHLAHTTHNDAVRHWQGDHGDPEENRAERTKMAIDALEASHGSYIDVHAWFFTPETFVNTMTSLSKSKHIPFTVGRMFPTRENALEFWVILRKI